MKEGKENHDAMENRQSEKIHHEGPKQHKFKGLSQPRGKKKGEIRMIQKDLKTSMGEFLKES